MQGGHTGHVGLVFGRRPRGEFGDRHSVGPGPFGQGGQLGPLVVRCGHDQFAAAVVGDSVVGAEVHQPFATPDG